MEPVSNSLGQRWQERIWLGVGLGLLLTIVMLLAFVGLTIWRTTSFIEERKAVDLAFTFSSMGLITLTLLRLLAVFIGAAISFAGLAISFYAHDRATGVDGEFRATGAGTAKATLATYSPGIVGVFVGAAIIIFALFAKSEHGYQGGKTIVLEPPPAQAGTSSASEANSKEKIPTLQELLDTPATSN
ncbi:hypothetical protein D3C87_1099160 [compost metagenome]